jgi:predicted nucleic acid-binding protein
MTMAWCFPDEATPHTEAVFNILQEDHEIFVPTLWPYEVANVLLGAVRKQRISSAKARDFMDDLESFTIKIDDGTAKVWESIYGIAEQHRLTSYDAAYLELAMRKRLPLASLDEDLSQAALSVGLRLFES